MVTLYRLWWCCLKTNMKNFYITWHNEWSQLGKKFNWHTATLINIEFENDIHTQTLEFMFVLFGFGFTIVYDFGFDNSKIGKQLKEIKENLQEYTEELDKKIDDILK